MSVKMRLARHGRKRYAFYHIVVANSRAPRDGRYIERIGSYNPNTNPATIDLDFDKAYDWLEKGAQPTDTVRGILSYKGVLYKKHLAGGVKKGALTQEEAERKLDVWMTEKEGKIQAKKNSLSSQADKDRRALLEAEAKVNEDRAATLAARTKTLAAEAAAARVKPAEEAPAEEAPVAEVKAEEVPVEEAPVAEVKAEEAPAEEAPVAEVKAEEAPAEEAPVAEVKAEEVPAEEAPVAEVKAEETPAADPETTEEGGKA
jgi:small subunit ribosomal protein S16